ncbi:Chromatin structure remodeling complex protein sfh1 [Lithohypha guttulata]|uniref:Chromatin structure remodeling complex protein sfh1 n=1 Tax=Lithohypha guttulata TaxID=1690604 RepID=UPI002DDF802E|nr:Chromatin structure remodeling complex protein sfh1 [Lithohypha guttulata]
MARQSAQAFQSSYAPRLRQYANSLAAPVLVTQAIPTAGRTTKRGTTVINYADDAYDEEDFEDSEGTGRRPTGLRSIRREDLEKKEPRVEKLGKEITEPIEVQPIFRSWIADGLRQRRPPYEVPYLSTTPITRWWDKLTKDADRTLQGTHAQAQFPLTLIPVRIEYEIQPSQQDTPFPIPSKQNEPGNILLNPAFRRPEPSPGYKIRDIFMWNLHETLFTPEDFAIAFVQDLDLPNPSMLVAEFSKQIRTQLEEYAGVALHPLFHTSSRPQQIAARASGNLLAQKVVQNAQTATGTSRPRSGYGTPAWESATPRPSTPGPDTPQPFQLPSGAQVTAEATPIPIEDLTEEPPQQEDMFLNLDDTYRCIITLSIYHASRLFQDKFEWSLLHPPGAAEIFAKQTCADLGLNGEWVLAITHAIYEAVLKLKKETCEGGNTLTVGGTWGQGDIDNQAVRAEAGAGWRYDDADFGAEWEPRLEILSKYEIEKREFDRERQLRRQRREMARFTSTAGMTPTAREQEAQQRGSYFDYLGTGMGDETPLMGRGERNRKKRKLRSPSPSAKATPEPQDGGWGGDVKAFVSEQDRMNWRCSHCMVWGTAVWAVRGGPKGPRTLCNNCAMLYERDKELPAWNKDLHKNRPKMPMPR